MSLELAYIDPDRVSVVTSGRVTVQRVGLELNDAIESLMTDTQARVAHIANQPNGEAFIRNFAAFQGRWIVWWREHDGDWEAFVSSLFNEAQGALRDFINEYNGYEALYRRFTGEQPTQPGLPDLPDPSGPGLPAWAWALIGVGGVFGIAWLFRESRGLVREGRDIYETERGRGTFRMRSRGAPPPSKLLLSR